MAEGRFYMMHFMKSHLQWVSYDCNLGSLKKIRAAEYTLLVFRNFSCYVLITPPLLIYELFNGHWPLDFFPSSLFVTRPTVSFAGILVYKVLVHSNLDIMNKSVRPFLFAILNNALNQM